MQEAETGIKNHYGTSACLFHRAKKNNPLNSHLPQPIVPRGTRKKYCDPQRSISSQFAILQHMAVPRVNTTRTSVYSIYSTSGFVSKYTESGAQKSLGQEVSGSSSAYVSSCSLQYSKSRTHLFSVGVSLEPQHCATALLANKVETATSLRLQGFRHFTQPNRQTSGYIAQVPTPPSLADQ